MNQCKLECPHCRITLPIDDWNENVKVSMIFGRAEELIPKDLTPDKWEDYKLNHSAIIDCPECGEVCNMDDMDIY